MNSFIKFFGDIITSCWCIWSNIRFKQAERNSTAIIDDDKIESLSDIKFIARRAYENFTWTQDGIDQLGDAIVPPPCAYKQISDGKLLDDCDGFHAAMYHILSAHKIECYLLTATAFGGGHCLLIFKFNNKWRILDYTKIYDSAETAQEAIERYDQVYPKIYSTKPVFYNGIVSYNYETGKYKALSVSYLK